MSFSIVISNTKITTCDIITNCARVLQRVALAHLRVGATQRGRVGDQHGQLCCHQVAGGQHA